MFGKTKSLEIENAELKLRVSRLETLIEGLVTRDEFQTAICGDSLELAIEEIVGREIRSLELEETIKSEVDDALGALSIEVNYRR